MLKAKYETQKNLCGSAENFGRTEGSVCPSRQTDDSEGPHRRAHGQAECLVSSMGELKA